MSNEDASDVEIAVSFVTRLPEEFRVSESAIEVPGRLTRYGLSEVVNHLLGAPTPTPFDFLIDGTLLRTSLAKLALRLGKSAEATLVVEYVPALGPPTAAETTKCEAWVSSIDGSWAKAVVTGSFDGKARLWSPVGKLLCELEGAEERVCSVSLAPPSAGADAENACVVLAASADHTLRSYAVTLTGKKCELGEQRVFKGHEGTVTDVASAYGARLFASCSVDCTARVWKIDGGESANEKVTKKRRTSKKSEATDDDARHDFRKLASQDASLSPPEHEIGVTASHDAAVLLGNYRGDLAALLAERLPEDENELARMFGEGDLPIFECALGLGGFDADFEKRGKKNGLMFGMLDIDVKDVKDVGKNAPPALLRRPPKAKFDANKEVNDYDMEAFAHAGAGVSTTSIAESAFNKSDFIDTDYLTEALSLVGKDDDERSGPGRVKLYFAVMRVARAYIKLLNEAGKRKR